MRKLLGALILVAGSVGAFAGDPTIDGFDDSTVVQGLTQPTALAFLPDGRMLVCEQGGALWLITANPLGPVTVGGAGTTRLGDIPTGYFGFDEETGLLGVAVDPDFDTNGFIYLYRTNTSQVSQEVIRMTIGANDTLDFGSLTIILNGISVDTPYHCGGGLRVDNDGKLLIGTGDTGNGDFGGGGPGSSTNPYAGDPSDLAGKILRINLPDGSIPNDNPLIGEIGADGRVFAYGFRNPWRFGVDPQTGDVWVGDVGEDHFEEINRIVPGFDFGWPRTEGVEPKNNVQKGDIGPVFVYPHGGKKSLGTSVTGGAFATQNFGFLEGLYVFGDFERQALYIATLDKARQRFKGKPALFAPNCGMVVDIVFGPQPDGSDAVYFINFIAGQVRKISPPPRGGDLGLPGKKLSMKVGTKDNLTVLLKGDADIGGDNPLLDGGSLTISGTGFDETYDLPAKNWSLIGKAPNKVKGFKYSDRKTVDGPVKSITIKDGKLVKISAKGDLGAVDLANDPLNVFVQLQVGTRQFCAQFGNGKHKPGKSYSAKNAPAIGGCD